MHGGVAALYLYSQTRATNDKRLGVWNLYEKQVKMFCLVEHFRKATYNSQLFFEIEVNSG